MFLFKISTFKIKVSVVFMDYSDIPCTLEKMLFLFELLSKVQAQYRTARIERGTALQTADTSHVENITY